MQSQRTLDILWAVAEARDRGGHQPLTLTGYCEGRGCPAREVEVFVKDHDDELDGLLEKNGFRCPLCGHPLKTHYVQTREEVHREEDRLARMSVNTQLYEQATGSSLVPMAVIGDERLPPVPDDWFEPKKG